MKKKALSLILSVIMVFGLCAPAFAENTYPQYDVYLALGDSIAQGSGLTAEDWADEYPKYDEGSWYTRNELKFVPTSYPYRIKEAVGASEDSFNGAYSGLRLNDLLACITGDRSYCDDATWNFFDGSWGPKGIMTDKNSLIRSAGYMQHIEDADLITINLGNNDLVCTMLYHIFLLMSSEESEYAGMFDDAIAQAETFGDYGKALVYLLSSASSIFETLDEYAAFLTKLVTVVEQNCISEFLRNWDVLLDIIYENNPDANVVAINIYNPCRTTFVSPWAAEVLGTALSQETASFISEFFQPMIDILNYEMQYGTKYSNDSRYVCVDVRDMENVLIEYSYEIDVMGAHPGPQGHKIMAQMILEALSKFCEHENKITLFETRASFFHDGYTGDVFCADCGKLLEQGAIVTMLGESVELPDGIGYTLIDNIMRFLSRNLTDFLNTIVTAVSTVFTVR